MKKITIKDVAKKLGVSVATVSNYINNTGRMSEKTRKKIEKEIKRLNFHPDKTAVILSKGKSDAIGFVSSYLTSPFVFSILRGVEHELYNLGKFRHSIEHYATRGYQSVKEELLRDLLYSKRAAAVIAVSININNKIIKEYKKMDIPLITIEQKSIFSVRCNNYMGAYNATQYLLKNKKRRIIIITGILKPKVFDEDVSPAILERLEGYKQALKDNKINFDKNYLFEVNYYNMEEGERIMNVIINSDIKFDAIFCAAGDAVAIGVINQAKKIGLKIPDDFSIIGFDDIDEYRFFTPCLTTVRQPLFEMGRKAFEIAVNAINKKIKKADIILETEFIKRDTA